MIRGAPAGSNIVQQQNGGDSFIKAASNSGVLSINAKSSQIKTSSAYPNEQWNGQNSQSGNQSNNSADNIASNMINIIQNEQRPIIQQNEQLYGYSTNGTANDYANNLYNMFTNEKQPTFFAQPNQPNQINQIGSLQEVYSTDSIAANAIGNIEREKPFVFDGGFNKFDAFTSNTHDANERPASNQNNRFNQYVPQQNYSETVTSSLQTYQAPTYSNSNSEQ